MGDEGLAGRRESCEPLRYNRRLMKRLFLAVLMVVTVAGLSAQPGRRRVSLIVTGGTVLTQNAAHRILTPGALAIDGTDIVDVDTPAAISAKYQAVETIDARDQIVMPGLINTHTHAPMVMYRGLADDLALMDWLTKYIFPAEAKTVSPELVRVGTRLAAVEMIESGTTAFVDMYYFEEEIAKAAFEAGLRGVLGETIIQFPVADAKTPAEGLARAETFIKEFKDNGLIVPAVAPHALYTNDQATLTASAALARKYGVPIVIHFAETEDEVKVAREQYQLTPTAALESIGVLGPTTIGAHGVWVNDADIAILKRTGTGVAHNPESNMKLASGAAPVTKYLAAGVKLGLGTDGAASNNDLDMFEAMRQASFLAKLTTRDPTAVKAQDALDMATLGGARVIGMEKLLGSLETGKRADLITVSMRAARQTPIYDPVSHIVYVTRGDDVRSTIVNGKVLMSDRRLRTLDRESVIADANRLAARVRAAVAPR
jgi:5-methylthioadenosine/S-adenosylhomocysteine deaminase